MNLKVYNHFQEIVCKMYMELIMYANINRRVTNTKIYTEASKEKTQSTHTLDCLSETLTGKSNTK